MLTRNRHLLQGSILTLKTIGPEHLGLATRFNNLANLYADQGKYEQAELHYQRALTIREKIFGAEHPNTVRVRERLTNLLQEKEQKTE